MSFILDILRSAGLGGDIVLGAMAILVAWYLFKSVKVGKFIGAALASGVGYAMVLLIGAGVAIAAGWIDPNLGRIGQHISTVTDAVANKLADFLAGKLEGML